MKRESGSARELNALAATDPLIPITRLPENLPERAGKKVHIATCFRWTANGLNGEVLRTISVGGQRCTRMSWVLDWAERVAAARLKHTHGIPRQRPIRRQTRSGGNH